MRQSRGEVKVWLKTKHGRRVVNRHVVAGVMPRNSGLNQAQRREAKQKIREEYLRTARVLSQQRVEEIVGAIALEAALIGDVLEREAILRRLRGIKVPPERGR